MEIVYYETPHDLPIRRYQKFNKYLMIAAEVGETLGDYDRRTQRAIVYLNNNDTANAAKELQNRRQAVFNALQEYSPTGLALACMVKSINGQQFNDISNEGLQHILNELDKQQLSRFSLIENIERLKKKLKASLRYIFPKILRTVRLPLMPQSYVKSKQGTGRFWATRGQNKPLKRQSTNNTD